ncbi:putative myb-like DNA-binding domain containing protein [Lyophyllum shimeji]|uniref:Myb-like DNA-binding domain containing protein n=1 Tax=Lyophyllum shimeji TaxID=47721 RepID=A0A9P3PJA3_LYOSH|nr:putative myb-like DNA-binding domain containing protein [Lyophyllum shimeji]
MAERNPSRPWTEEEDALLTHAVQIHGEHENWKNVASLVPGRTNKACRKRWLHSLSPTIRKSAWTSDEDNLLLSLYNIHGAKWSTIAREIPGRTDDACSKRYREALDPHLKKDEWTTEEDQKLLERYAAIGGKWGQLGQELQRSGLGCRNRYRLLSKKASKVLYEPVANRISDPSSSQPRSFVPSEVPHSSAWPTTYPYYPPEAYPCFPTDGSSLDLSFEEPALEVPAVSPDVAPFQFSSSSLSAALADVPQSSRSLPTIYESEHTNATLPPAHDETHQDPTTQASQVNFPLTFEHHEDLSRIFLGVHFDENGVFHYPEGNDTACNSPNGMIPETEGDPWEHFIPDLFASPASTMLPLQGSDVSLDRNASDMSSTLSTPFNFTLSLSDPSTPNLLSPVDLPSSEQPSGTAVTSPNRRSPRTRRRRGRKPEDPGKPHRLSSSLPLTTDLSVKPYACGRERCWPKDARMSSSCFATSKELFEHSKVDHARDIPGDRPFRCALAGCGKSWKSLNGLQYHLQLSTAHFRAAVSSTFSLQRQAGNDIPRPSSASGSGSDAEAGDEPRRTYVCHHPQCFKAYRQPSGLRYHLKHGHPSQLPAQLAMVPPALARQLPSKTKKMRQKAATDGDA